ncbi:hypothetical protein [Chroococcidiopsis sp. TS-821]|uniref:hypothetical protein n=1 Tax=Chroococcidiopsis sp. TS-821 TaxID=1378066 RepID=UPI000CEEF05A|nr:hypothetical protein [Chroococcidiopsis sp. TS-821]PPS42720.1 hypothetical protein B1A85_13450 [Chroococcidiopsis sp. TS-821]
MPKLKPYFERRYPWRERGIAILALINLILVLFDATYLYSRDFYLQTMPSITRLYDPVKGIQPHPETESYLAQVAALEAQVALTGLQSPQTARELARMRALSQMLIEDNPFAAADKSSQFETIKQRLRVRTGETFARDAFARFWSQSYLTQAGWQQEMEFWQARIRPLMRTNYYRSVNRLDTPTNHFWLLDLPFVVIFALDLWARVTRIRRRYPYLSWLEAILRRWYDVFLLLPFWRLLRILPVSVRLYHTGLLNLDPLRAEAQRDFVISFAAELTEMAGIQIVEQMQNSIRNGDVFRWLLHPELRKPYVQVNNVNEVSAIASRLFRIGVYDVLPKVQPDIEDLIHHSLMGTLHQLPGNRLLRHIPGLRHAGKNQTRKLAKAIFNVTYNNLTNSMQDPVGAELTARLGRNLRDALENELQKKHNVQEIQSLLIDMLEEIKINYVKGITEAGSEQLLEKAEQLHKRIRH